jgi:hypothetical protein
LPNAAHILQLKARRRHPASNRRTVAHQHNDDSWFVSGRITRSNVKITVRFGFHSNDAARENGQKRRQTLSRHANLFTKVGL